MNENMAAITERLRSKASGFLRRTADAVDGTAAQAADVRSVSADGTSSVASPVRRKRRPSRPFESLRGYMPEDLPHDIAAGAVVAALSIPIAMGYAEVIGLPAIYGLYASIVAPLAFALATGTRRIVFGMDSAVSAVTGSILVSAGLADAGGDIGSIIGLVTILTGVFLALFSFLGAGRLARFIPAPVMHGFIAGVSLTVIVTQIPGLIGTTADMSGGFLSDVRAAFASISEANGPSTFIAAISLGIIVHLKKTLPKVPAALVVLVITTIMCAVLQLDKEGVSILGAIDAGFPVPAIPHVEGGDLLPTLGCALVIAVVASIESLLCLETFSMKAGIRPEGNRELLSFGIGNMAAGLFGCPPCSASLSRTAAGISTGARTQVTSISAAIIVAAVILVLSPALYYLPRPSLSAIVIVALIDVVDFEKAARYARHMMLEFVVFLVSAVVVLAYGAIAGVIVGIVASLVVAFYRDRRSDQQALLGVAYDEGAFGKKGPKPNVDYAVLRLEGHLSFLNIDAKIDALLNQIDDSTRAVIIKLNKVDSLDSTAADKLILLVDMLHARNMHVKIVRKMRPTNDSYTRHEMRRIMRDAKFYPNMSAALAGLSRDLAREARAAAQAEAERQAAKDALAARSASRQALPADSVAVLSESSDIGDPLLLGDGAGLFEGEDAASATPDRQHPAFIDTMSSAAHDLTGRLMNRLVKDEPLEVRTDDRIVMTVQEASGFAGNSELEGKLSYIRAHEAILFAVGFDDGSAEVVEAEAGVGAEDAATAETADVATPEGAEAPIPADAASDDAKSQKGKKAKAKAAKKSDKAPVKDGESGAETSSAATAAAPSTDKAHAKAKKGAHKKDAAAPAYTTATLRREKTGELLAEYVDGSWRWYYPAELLEPAVELIDSVSRGAAARR